MTDRALLPRPKRLVIVQDGTWNSPATRKQRDDGDEVFKPTNPLKTCRAVRDVDDVTATLVLEGQPLDGETVTIGGKAYVFVEDPEASAGVDGHVAIGDTTQKSLENLAFAIDLRRHRGRYSDATTRHPTVAAREVPGDRFCLDLVARLDGENGADAGDPFDVSTTLGRGHWASRRQVAGEIRARGLDPRHGVPQVVYYDIGVGALRRFPGPSNRVHRLIDNAFGGARGAGFESNIEDAYLFLSLNYRQGDEVYVFGFSRGAASARGLCRFVDWMGGLLPPRDSYWVPRYFDAFLVGQSMKDAREEILEHLRRKPGRSEEAVQKLAGEVVPARIRFLGVWDTVLSLGERRERPHFGDAPPAVVDHARQALALDESRPDFEPRLWRRRAHEAQTLEQRWFAGVHSNIGGGYVDDGLANIALHWILRAARDAGLGLDWDFLSHYPRYVQDRLYESNSGFWRFVQLVTLRGGLGVREIRVDEAAGLSIDPSVFQRLVSTREGSDGRIHEEFEIYRPLNLLRFLATIDDLDAFLATIPGLGDDFELPEDVRRAIREAR